MTSKPIQVEGPKTPSVTCRKPLRSTRQAEAAASSSMLRNSGSLDRKTTTVQVTCDVAAIWRDTLRFAAIVVILLVAAHDGHLLAGLASAGGLAIGGAAADTVRSVIKR